MGLLERARSLVASDKEREETERRRENWEATKRAVKEANRILQINLSPNYLAPNPDHAYTHEWTFIYEKLQFRIIYAHRGYDNLGGGMFWELYCKTRRSYQTWQEIGSLQDLAIYESVLEKL